MSINVFTFSGNCGDDLEIRFTPNRKAIGQVNVPCKSGWGENEKTTWITCKLFGDRAEKLAQYLTKGTKVTVTGRFELDQWEKDGVKHSRPVCIVSDIEWSGQSSPREQQQPQQSPRNVPPPEDNNFNDFDDSEIPF